MQVSVREVARLLKVSDKTIYRWIQERRIPVYKVGDVFRFNRAEIAEWAVGQRIAVSPDLLIEPDGPAEPAGICDALGAGGVFYRVAGTTRAEVFHSVVDIMPLPEDTDREFFFDVLMAREDMGSTGIGHGIAIPHPRTPLVLHVTRPSISLCFLESGVDFAALDDQPVNTLFTVVTPTVRAHLHLLSRLAFVLQQAVVREVLAGRGSREEIMFVMRDAEAAIAQGQKGSR